MGIAEDLRGSAISAAQLLNTMENNRVVDLRDIKPRDKSNRILEAPVNIPNSKPIIAAEKISTGMYTPEQVKKFSLIYYFERPDGSCIGVSALDAHNIRERRDPFLTYIGASDGSMQKQIYLKYEAELAPLRKRLASISAKSVELNGNVPPSLIAEHDEIVKRMRDIDQEAIEAEASVARNNKIKLPNFSVVGDQRGVAEFDPSKFNG